MSVVAVPLAVTCLGLAIGHVARAVVPLGGRACAGGHAAMALGMAAMWLPVADPLPTAGWAAVFVLLGAWFGSATLRAGSLSGELGHLVVGSAAMVFMLLAHAPMAAADAAGGGHGHHGGAGPGASGPLVVAVALVLGAWFVCEVLLAGRAWAAGRTSLVTAGAPGGGASGPQAGPAADPAPAGTDGPDRGCVPQADRTGGASWLATARPAMCAAMSGQMALMLLLMT
jgi:hypothetical protein